MTLPQYFAVSALLAGAQWLAIALMTGRALRAVAAGQPRAAWVTKVRGIAASMALYQLLLFVFWGNPAPGAGFFARQLPYAWFLGAVLLQLQSLFLAEKRLRGLEATAWEYLVSSARSLLTSAARTWIGLFLLMTLALRWSAALSGWPHAQAHFELLFGAGYGLIVALLVAADIVLAPRLLRLSSTCRRLEGEQAERLAARFEKAGLRRPEVWALELERIGGHNAMVTGLRAPWRLLSPELFVTRSLVERFPPEELDAVVAHELAHAKLRHVATRCALSAAFLFALPMAALWMLKWYGGGAALSSFESSLLFFAGYALHNIAVNTLSQRQELEADAYAVTALGAPLEAMIGALRRLTELNDQLEKSPDAASHPNLASREAELRRRAAGPAEPDRRARLAGLALCGLAAALALPVDYYFRLQPQHELCLAAGRGDIPALDKWFKRAGGPDAVKTLARTGPLDLEDPLEGGAPIVWAVRARRREAYRWLFDHGATSAPLYAHGRTPMHIFVRVADEELVAGSLSLRLVPPNERDDDGRTVLFEATRSTAIAAALIDGGADVNAKDKAGNTPLTEAVSDLDPASYEVARLLLSRGAKTDVVNEDGMTLAELAGFSSDPRKEELFPSEIDRLARYEAPAGWPAQQWAQSPDAFLHFTKSTETVIMVRLFGGEGSVFASPEAYMKDPSATTQGLPPKTLRTVTVAGRSVKLYEIGQLVGRGDSYMGTREAKLGREIFCLVPSGRRFFVLSYAEDRPQGDHARAAGKAWEAFLKSFAIRAPARS